MTLRLLFSCLALSATATALPAVETNSPPVRAQLTARAAALLAAELGAKVQTVHVIEGGAFKKGDCLVTFDDTLQRSQLERAEAVYAAAQRTFSANQRLHRLNSVGQVELDLSETEVAKAQAELNYARAMLAKCRIVAPFSGRVAEQRIHEQEFVQPGQALLEVIDDAVPEVDFIAPSKWLAWIKPGQRLEISIDETGRSYSARVERIGARVDPVSQSVKIVAGLDPAATELIAGMSGVIRVPSDTGVP